MKITAILGSPRKKGATSSIAGGFLETARQNGADVGSYFLNNMRFQGCQGCQGCKTRHDRCVLKDDLTPVLTDMQSSDIMVFATPVYFWDVTGQFKCFFDRTWSLVKPDYTTNPLPVRLEPGKQAVWISSQGDVAEKHRDVVEKYTGFLTMFGCNIHVIRAFGMEDEIGENIDPWLNQARELAGKLTG